MPSTALLCWNCRFVLQQQRIFERGTCASIHACVATTSRKYRRRLLFDEHVGSRRAARGGAAHALPGVLFVRGLFYINVESATSVLER